MAGMSASIIGDDGHRKAPTASPEYPDFGAIEVEFEGRLAIVTLGSDPNRANPSDTMTPALTEFFRIVRYDPNVRGILLQGRGNKFSSGGNVKGMREQAGRMGNIAENPDWVARIPVDRSDELIMAMLSVDAPIVAAVTGHAIGAGLGLALWSDIAVIDENAKIGDPHVRRGLASPGAYSFPGLIGLPRARAMLLTGRLIRGSRAAEIGLIDQAVPADEVVPTAREVLDDLASLPPLAIRWTKRQLNYMVKEQFLRYSTAGSALESLTMLSTDHARSVAAWLDKEPEPDYEGR